MKFNVFSVLAILFGLSAISGFTQIPTEGLSMFLSSVILILLASLMWKKSKTYVKKKKKAKKHNKNKHQETNLDNNDFSYRNDNLGVNSNNNDFSYNDYHQISNDVRIYYDTLDKIEQQWVLLSELNKLESDLALNFIELCKKAISYYDYIFEDYEKPSYCMAYKRLIMYYAKIGKYEEAISYCEAAIVAGSTEDGTKGKMYARLIKLSKKANIELTDSQLALINSQFISPTYVVLDLETTGLSPANDGIVEISAIRFVNNKEVERFEKLVNPNILISSRASKINGITNQMIKNAPMVDDIVFDLYDFLGNDLIVGHNISFDLSFINALFSKHGLKLNNKSACTLAMARKSLNLSSNKLIDVANYFNIDTTGNHRASKDAEITAKIYQNLM